MLKEVGVGAGVKRRAKSLDGNYQGSREAVFIRTRMMKEVLDQYAGWDACGNHRGSGESDFLAAEIVIVFCERDGIIVLLNGSRINDPRGRGGVGGGSLSKSGSTVEAHDE
jgi:hypothetical protein